MRTVRVGVLAALAVVLVGTIGAGVAAADGDEAFAVVPEGMHVDASVDDPELEARLATELGVEVRAVRVHADSDVVEVLSTDVTPAAFADALEANGVEAGESDVRDRPADETMDTSETVLQQRYQTSPVEASVEVRGGHLLVDPTERGAEARELVTTPGVEVLATVPGDDGLETVTVLTSDDYENIGEATQSSGAGDVYVPVSLSESAGEAFQAAMREYGFDRQGGTTCGYDLERSLERNLDEMSDEHRCLVTSNRGEVVYASGVASGLSASFRNGAFAENPVFRTNTVDLETARELGQNLRSGSLPTEVTIRSPDEVSRDGGGSGGGDLEAVTADGTGFGPLVALLGVVSALLGSRTRRR